MQVDAFMPAVNGTVLVNVTTSNQVIAMTGSGNDVELQNTGTANFFVEQDPVNNTPVAVVATSYPVLPGQSKVIRLRPGVTKLAFIGAAATAAFVSFGDGV